MRILKNVSRMIGLTTLFAFSYFSAVFGSAAAWKKNKTQSRRAISRLVRSSQVLQRWTPWLLVDDDDEENEENDLLSETEEDVPEEPETCEQPPKQKRSRPTLAINLEEYKALLVEVERRLLIIIYHSIRHSLPDPRVLIGIARTSEFRRTVIRMAGLPAEQREEQFRIFIELRRVNMQNQNNQRIDMQNQNLQNHQIVRPVPIRHNASSLRSLALEAVRANNNRLNYSLAYRGLPVRSNAPVSSPPPNPPVPNENTAPKEV